MLRLSLSELAAITGAELRGDGSRTVEGVGSLDDASPTQLAFLSSDSFKRHLPQTRAAVVILKAEHLDQCPVDALVTDNPNLAYALAAQALSAREPLPAGIHPSAFVDPTAEISDKARIEPNCTIGAGVHIADGVVVGPNCVVAEGCSIAADSHLVASVTLMAHTRVGERCLIHPGAVLGADGFGMANREGRWVKVPQLGGVVLGDDVEVGACTTIDRGAIKDTVIGNGVKLDNQIQIGHNVEVGEHTAMAAGVGISGSTRIGAYCTIAGAAGMAGHLELADRVHVSGMTAVTRSLREPGVYTSTVPAMSHDQWRKNFARLKQLDDMARRLRALEKALAGQSAQGGQKT